MPFKPGNNANPDGRGVGWKHDKATKKKISNSMTKHGVWTLDNALKHNTLDGRTTYAKQLALLESQLMDRIPSDPTPELLIMLQRVARKTVLVAACEEKIMSGEFGNEAYYISLSNSLRLDIAAFDKLLEDQGKPKALDYHSYVASLEADKDAKNE